MNFRYLRLLTARWTSSCQLISKVWRQRTCQMTHFVLVFFEIYNMVPISSPRKYAEHLQSPTPSLQASAQAILNRSELIEKVEKKENGDKTESARLYKISLVQAIQAIAAGSFNKNDTKFLITLISSVIMGEAMTIIQNVTSRFQVAKTTETGL